MKPKIVNRKLGKHKADGLAYIEDNEIHLDTRMAGKRHFNVTIHEYLHILFPEWSETKVKTTANKLSSFLREQNYRKVINK